MIGIENLRCIRARGQVPSVKEICPGDSACDRPGYHGLFVMKYWQYPLLSRTTGRFAAIAAVLIVRR